MLTDPTAAQGGTHEFSSRSHDEAKFKIRCYGSDEVMNVQSKLLDGEVGFGLGI